MAYNETTYKATTKYKSAHIKRIPLDVQLSEYELIKASAEASGMSVNGFIKQAIRQAMERDGYTAGTHPQGDMPGPGSGGN